MLDLYARRTELKVDGVLPFSDSKCLCSLLAARQWHPHWHADRCSRDTCEENERDELWEAVDSLNLSRVGVGYGLTCCSSWCVRRGPPRPVRERHVILPTPTRMSGGFSPLWIATPSRRCYWLVCWCELLDMCVLRRHFHRCEIERYSLVCSHHEQYTITVFFYRGARSNARAVELQRYVGVDNRACERICRTDSE